jgi:hypothetical protein
MDQSMRAGIILWQMWNQISIIERNLLVFPEVDVS